MSYPNVPMSPEEIQTRPGQRYGPQVVPPRFELSPADVDAIIQNHMVIDVFPAINDLDAKVNALAADRWKKDQPQNIITINELGHPCISNGKRSVELCDFWISKAQYFSLSRNFGSQSFYLLTISKGTIPPLCITESDFAENRKLLHMITMHGGGAINPAIPRTKAAEFLRDFVRQVLVRQTVPFFGGWSQGEGDGTGVTFSVFPDGATHQDPTNPQLDARPVPVAGCDSLPDGFCDLTPQIQLTAMVSISYTLLDQLGYRFPMGLCLLVNDGQMEKKLLAMLSWFSDAPVFLGDSPTRFAKAVSDHKDEPVLVVSENVNRYQRANLEDLEAAIATGKVGASEDAPPLQGLPITVTKSVDATAVSPMFLTVPIHDNTVFGLDDPKIVHQLAGYTALRVGTLREALKEGEMWSAEEPRLQECTSREIKAAGIIYGVLRFLSPATQAVDEDFIIDVIFDHLAVTTQDNSLAQGFYLAAKSMIRSGELDLVAFDKCTADYHDADTEVLMTEDILYFPHAAFRSVCRKILASVPQVTASLEADKALRGSRIHRNSAQTRITVRRQNGCRTMLPVYSIPRNRIEGLFDPLVTGKGGGSL